MITLGEDCLKGTHSCEVAIDPAAPTTSIIISTGTFFKDDCLHSIDSDFSVNMVEQDFYVDSSLGFWNEVGYYFIVADYTYVKSKPAPRVSIKIIKPSQHALLTSAYLFLKAVLVSFNGATFEITSIHDFLPTNPLIRRSYAKTYLDAEDTLPTFDVNRDEGRMVYTRDNEGIYFGQSGRWESVQAVRDEIDTVACTVGQLGYIGADGAIYPAISTSPGTFADCAVLQVGTKADGSGQVRLFGKVLDVPIQTGITISIGEKVYLSETTAGSITNLISTPYAQGVGVCIDIDAANSTTCDIWFSPGSGANNGNEGTSTENLYDRYQDLLISSIYKRLTVDAFINTDYVDLIQTSASIDAINYEIDGTVGEMLVTTNLTEPSFDSTCIISCQISAEMTNDSNITWYVTNDGVNFEYTNLDEIHTFSTQQFASTQNVGILSYGEWVVGSMSGKRGIVRCVQNTLTGLSDVTGSGDWQIGEILTGETSGNSVRITGATQLKDDCIDLRILAYFTGNASIQDYGILYDVDTEVDETSRNNELNIDTLYSDLYEVPSQDNDGLRNYPFSDTTAIPILEIVDRDDTITGAIVKLDNNQTKKGVGQFEESDSTPSVSEDYNVWLTFDCDSTSSFSITNIDDGYLGKEITIVNSGSLVTIVNSSDIRLASGADYTMTFYDTLTLVYINSNWVEKSRSVN